MNAANMNDTQVWSLKQRVIKALSFHLNTTPNDEVERVVSLLVEKLPEDFIAALDIAYQVTKNAPQVNE